MALKETSIHVDFYAIFSFEGIRLDIITGTSACSAGKFYCRNVGSKPEFIFSSHVYDRYCGKHCLPCY